MVKCLLCGAIFEEGMEKCPICGAGPEHFVLVAKEEAAFRRDTDERFLILGAGIAGLSAAEAIRERNATSHIILATEEDFPPYNRPMLTKNFAASIDDIAIHDEAWYQQKNFLVLKDRRAVRIDPAAREVAFSDGARLSYDRLLLALGASSFLPPIPGIDLPGVQAIRSPMDVRKIDAMVKGGKRRAVVIGGGVLGLEAASELLSLGCSVTILERSDRIMARQLDIEGSLLLKTLCEQAGARILTGASTKAIESHGDTLRIVLENGETLPADLVIISSGVKPSIALAKEAGIETGRAIIVDDYMETSLHGIYACGDCAEYNGANMAIWPVAQDMGRIAGANAAGDRASYRPGLHGISFQGMGTSLFAIGDVGSDEGATYRTQAVSDAEKGVLQKHYFKGDALCGAEFIGRVEGAMIEDVTKRIRF